MVLLSCNPSILETEAGGLPRVRVARATYKTLCYQEDQVGKQSAYLFVLMTLYFEEYILKQKFANFQLKSFPLHFNEDPL